MSDKKIPHIVFKPNKLNSKTSSNFGFEIVPIEKVTEFKEKGSHNPELPHQLKFYNLIFFTEGSGRHFIDFNWFSVKKK